MILAAEQEGDHILLSISDDGKGMDADVLRAIAVKKGLMDKDAADRLSESDCFNQAFAFPLVNVNEIVHHVGARQVEVEDLVDVHQPERATPERRSMTISVGMIARVNGTLMTIFEPFALGRVDIDGTASTIVSHDVHALLRRPETSEISVSWLRNPERRSG